MHLELTDEQTEALIRELHSIIQNDRYPLSPRIVALVLPPPPAIERHLEQLGVSPKQKGHAQQVFHKSVQSSVHLAQ